jgi:pimeloyl-ACP methyl ester carboxylesterase
MQETILRVGAPVPLNGVICRPHQPNELAPVVLLLNSGLMHHVGSCRLSVKLARLLAAQGISSVRFDFPGIGDSPMRRDRIGHLENSPQEVAEVMDEVTKQTGAKRFVLFGLCSGADAAFATALRDQRVVGISQIDPYVFHTKRWYINHYLPRLFDFSVWYRLFKSKYSSAKVDDFMAFIEVADEAREMMSQQDIGRGYSQLVDRNIAIQVIVTGGQAYIYNYEEQFYDIYSGVEWQENLDLSYFPKAEHIISEPEYQEKTEILIVNWVLKQVKA